VAAYLEIDDSNNNLDLYHEKMIAPIDLRTGKIIYPAIDKEEILYEEHPITKEKIIGFQIPKWEEVKKICEEIALEIPQVGYVSWDICVGEEKVFVIEGNEFPSHEIYGLPPHRTNNIGLLPVFRAAEERKYEE